MPELKIFMQRRRKMLSRLMALIAIAVGVLVAVALPKADASDHQRSIEAERVGLLLSPARVSSDRFMTAYALAYR